MNFRRFRFRPRETVEQCFVMAVESLPVIALSMTITSVLLVTEFSFHMKLVLRQDSLVPAFASLFLVRELGAVLTAFLLVSRVGAGMAAELAIMRLTEQIEALESLGIDPVDYLILPRFLASLIAAVSLTILSIGLALVGSAYIGSQALGYLPSEFFNTMFTFMHTSDFLICIIKAVVFGSIIPLCAAFHGLRSELSSKGVGNAATQTVVHAFVIIILFDFILVLPILS